MDNHALYVKDIQSRNQKRFIIGFLARLKSYIKNNYAVYVARRNGANIGSNVSIPLALARKANLNLTIGNHASIQTSKLDLRAPITIGNYVIIGIGVEIITCSHHIDSPNWEMKKYGIFIRDYVWVATNALILPSCTEIKKGAVVGAGSVVSKTIESMHIVAGNPAQLIRKRKQVHYNLCVEGLLGNDLITYNKVRKGILD